MIIRQIGEIFNTDVFPKQVYFSNDHILEADILIIDLQSLAREIVDRRLGHDDDQNPVLSEKTVEIIQKAVADRNNLLEQYFEAGNNLFVFFPKPLSTVFRVGTKQNNQTTSIDFLSFIGLKSKNFSLKAQTGDIIDYASGYENFFNAFKTSYQFIIKDYIGEPIGVPRKTNTPVALKIPVKNGFIVVLPNLSFPNNSAQQYQGTLIKAKNAFIELDTFLKSKSQLNKESSPIPAWLVDYPLADETKELEYLSQLENQKNQLEIDIQRQQEVLNNFAELKKLIYCTGNELEDIVKKVISEIGYTLEETGQNRDDLIISTDQNVGVVEIKGVKGSSAEKHAAQLMKWVSGYYADHGINPKGILLVNSYRETPIVERIEATFPNQMLAYCTQMELCLLTTVQLLEIYLDYKAGKISFDDIHDLLFKTVGILNYDGVNKVLSTYIEEQKG